MFQLDSAVAVLAQTNAINRARDVPMNAASADSGAAEVGAKVLLKADGAAVDGASVGPAVALDRALERSSIVAVAREKEEVGCVLGERDVGGEWDGYEMLWGWRWGR